MNGNRKPEAGSNTLFYRIRGYDDEEVVGWTAIAVCKTCAKTRGLEMEHITVDDGVERISREEYLDERAPESYCEYSMGVGCHKTLIYQKS